MQVIERSILKGTAVMTQEVIDNIHVTNWEDYVEMAAFTARDDYHNVEHYVTGLGTEAGELLDAFKKNRVYKEPLDSINVLEEVGDIVWYASGLFRLWDRSFIPLVHKSNDDDLFSHARQVFIWSGEAVQSFHVYEMLGYDDLLEQEISREKILDATHWIMYHGYEMLNLLNFEVEECHTRNIKKLWTRYQGKFNEKMAKERDLDAERDALEL